jgi:HEAT repeat protein
LIRAVKTDSSGVVVNQAIMVLGAFKSRAAVEGLIEWFDAELKRRLQAVAQPM